MTERAFAVLRDRDHAVAPEDEAPARPLPTVGKRSMVELVVAYAARPAEPAPPGPVIQRAVVAAPVGRTGLGLGALLAGLPTVGAALPGPTADRLGRLFGHELSHVRVHTDAAAARAAHQLGARAFTIGDDIYFGAGTYAPGTAAGDRLLAHELTHVVQFDRGQLTGAGGAQLSHPDDATEREAAAMEHRADALPAEPDRAPTGEPDRVPAAEPGLEPALAAPRVAAPVALPRNAYRAAHGHVLRAIGFEIQTHFVVRTPQDAWLGYGQQVFVDQRADGGAYFELVVDHAPVPHRLPEDPELAARDAAVLELVLPHVETKPEQQLLAARAELMRQALARCTADGTAESRIEQVVAEFERLLGTARFRADATGRAAGIELPGAIVGQDGEPTSTTLALPQVTVGVPLADVPHLLCEAANRAALTAPQHRGIASFILDAAQRLGATGLPADTIGLALLVETYLYCGQQAEGPLAYPKEIAPWMARTNFHSMHEALGEEGKRGWAFYAANIAKPAEEDPVAPVIPSGFPQGGATQRGPAIHDWLDSIAHPELFPLEAADLTHLTTRFHALLSQGLQIVRDAGTPDLAAALVAAGASPEAIALEVAIRTPAQPRAMPAVATVRALFAALAHDELGGQICDRIAALRTDLESRDLMSRGSVNRAATSMGSMKVRGQGPEAGMAILENRMMPPWQTPAANPDAQVTQRPDAIQGGGWYALVVGAFGFLEATLAQAARARAPARDEDEDEAEDDRGRDRSPVRRPAKRALSPERDPSSPEPGPEPSPSGPLPSSAVLKKRAVDDGEVIRDHRDLPTRVRYPSRTYQVTRVAADGNCFYECCAQLLRDGRDAGALRQLVAQSALLSVAEQQAAATPGAYAGDPEIAAAAAVLGLTIVTHEGPHAGRTVLPRAPVGAGARALHLLHLYNPAEAQGHFDLLQ